MGDSFVAALQCGVGVLEVVGTMGVYGQNNVMA